MSVRTAALSPLMAASDSRASLLPAAANRALKQSPAIRIRSGLPTRCRLTTCPTEQQNRDQTGVVSAPCGRGSARCLVLSRDQCSCTRLALDRDCSIAISETLYVHAHFVQHSQQHVGHRSTVLGSNVLVPFQFSAGMSGQE